MYELQSRRAKQVISLVLLCFLLLLALVCSLSVDSVAQSGSIITPTVECWIYEPGVNPLYPAGLVCDSLPPRPDGITPTPTVSGSGTLPITGTLGSGTLTDRETLYRLFIPLLDR